jgi:hypothetical protein
MDELSKTTVCRRRVMKSLDSLLRSLEREPDTFVVESLGEILPPEWVQEAVEAIESPTRQARKLPSQFVIWFVILLGLYRRVSYSNLIEKVHETRWTKARWREGAPTTKAITQARDRVGIEPLRYLYRRSAFSWLSSSRGSELGGRRVLVLLMDGTTLKTADTAENRARFGLPGASRGRSAFPQMRAVLLVDAQTHLIAAERHESYDVGEMTLARDMVEDIEPGSVVVLDRNFHAYDFLLSLAERGIDYVLRVKTDRFRCRPVRHLGKQDEIVHVLISPPVRRRCPALPQQWTLRRVTYRPPGSAEEITLLTTLLDPKKVKKKDLIDTYHSRWQVEGTIDELKTHLCDCATVNRPVVFRSMTPPRVEQEYYGLLIAFNALCVLRARAAARGQVPAKLSFTATLERTREASYDMMRLPRSRLPMRFRELLRAIRRAEVPTRPGRSYPRAVRVKMSTYKLKQPAA